jgi:DNA-binding NarL/FixJ family response regulator
MTDIRIVLIEDHDLTRLGLKAALQQVPGMTVVGEAASGSRGLSLLETERPDIAIVDIGLPDIDGIEVVERLRQAQIWQSLNSRRLRRDVVVCAYVTVS